GPPSDLSGDPRRTCRDTALPCFFLARVGRFPGGLPNRWPGRFCPPGLRRGGAGTSKVILSAYRDAVTRAQRRAYPRFIEAGRCLYDGLRAPRPFPASLTRPWYRPRALLVIPA